MDSVIHCSEAPPWTPWVTLHGGSSCFLQGGHKLIDSEDRIQQALLANPSADSPKAGIEYTFSVLLRPIRNFDGLLSLDA